MANEIEVSEHQIVGVNGDVVIYGSDVIAQQMDYNASQQDSSALASTTEMVRIKNTSTTAIRVRLRPEGPFTISASNSVYLGGNEFIEVKATKNAGMIVSTINA